MDDNDWEPLSESDMKLIAARRERSDMVSKRMGDYLLKGYKMLATTCPECETILLQTRQGKNYCVACEELDSDVGKDDPILSQTAAMSMARELELASAAATPQAISATKPSGQAAQGTVSSTAEAASATPASSQSPRPETTGVRSKSKTPAPDQGKHSSSEAGLGMTSIDVQSWSAKGGDVTSRSAPQTARSDLRIKTEFGDGDSGVCSLLSNSHVTNDTSELQTPRSNTSQHIQALVTKIQWASQELNKTGSVEYSIQLCNLIKTASEAVVAVRSARI